MSVLRLWVIAALAACRASQLPAQSAPSWPDLAFRLVRYELDARIDYTDEQVLGTARLTVRNGSRGPAAEVPVLTYRLMPVQSVTDGAGRQLPFVQQVVAVEDSPRRQVNFARVTLPAALPPDSTLTLVVHYAGFLLGYGETGTRYVRDRVDPAFTILRNDGLGFPEVGFPSYRANRSAGRQAFDYVGRITVPDSLWVANGGRLRERRVARGLATFVYQSIKPAWRMDFAIAPYRTLEQRDLRVVYFPADSAGAKMVLDAAEQSLQLYQDWFGPLPDSVAFTIIEIPDGFGSQADVTSILQTAAAFRDSSQRRQLYHEISHLWQVPPDEPGSARLSEGLATFLEYYTADHLGGTRLLNARVEAIRGWLQARVASDPKLRLTPLRDYGREGMTDFSYSTGMILFAVLHGLVGDQRFRRIIRECHVRSDEACTSLDDFVRIAGELSPHNLSGFFDDWIYSTRWVHLLEKTRSIAELVSLYRSPWAAPVEAAGAGETSGIAAGPGGQRPPHE